MSSDEPHSVRRKLEQDETAIADERSGDGSGDAAAAGHDRFKPHRPVRLIPAAVAVAAPSWRRQRFGHRTDMAGNAKRQWWVY